MSDTGSIGYAAGPTSTDLRRLALSVLQPGFTGHTAPEWLLSRLSEGLGGVALFARNIDTSDQLAALTAAIHAENPAALIAIDEEGGDVTRLEHSTGSSWPGNLALGIVDDVELTERVAAEIGARLAAVGIDLDYAPDADVNVNAANPVIGVRSFGSDPALVARHTAAWVTGLQSSGVLACAKHFPGHGDTGVDSHLELPEIDLGNPATSASLQPFRAAVTARSASIMSAHVRIPDLDSRPATLAPSIMTDLLREGLGFTGLALSDGLEMGALAAPLGVAEGAVQAIAAGVDALCIGGGLADTATVDDIVAALVDAVRGGRLPEARLIEASARVAAASARDALHTAATAAAQRSHTAPGAAPAGLAAARRALRVHGAIPEPLDSSTTPHVVELAAQSNIAVGDETASGIATAVGQRWPAARQHRLTSDSGLASELALAQGQPLWVVVRDAHRHGWMGAAVSEVVRHRPDAVILDIGWPRWSPDDPVAHVVTHGASWASGEAVVELLTH